MAFDAGSIETTLDLDRTPFSKGLDKAEADAKAFEKKKFKATLDIDVDRGRLDKALADLNKNNKAKIKVDVDLDDAQVKKKVDEVDKKIKAGAGSTGKGFASALLNPIVIQLGLLPAIAAVSAAGVAGALAIPVAGFAIWGAAALKNNEQVRGSFRDLKNEVGLDSKEMADQLRPALIGVAQETKVAWEGVKPQLTGMFKDAAPLVTELSDGLIDLGLNAMPGVQLAMERGKKSMEGWNTFLGRVGTGLADLFDNASRHADAAGVGVSALGTTVQMLLGFVGSLIGVFAEAWAQISGPFNGALEQMLQTVLAFAHGALPAMGGGLGGLLMLIQGIMAVMGPFADTFGSVTGQILGVVVAYKVLKKTTDAVGTGFGSIKTKVTGLATDFRNSSLGVQVFGEKTKKVAKEVGEGLENTATSSKKAGEGVKEVGEKAAAGSSGVGKFANTAQKVTGFLGKLGNNLPIIGAAFVLVDSIVQEATKTNEQAADEVDAFYEQQRQRADKQYSEIRDAAQKTADATNYYNSAVQSLGTNSFEAGAAQEKLARQTLAEKDAQTRAAEATKTHTERLLDFFSALTGQLDKQVAYNNSVKDLKDKQQALADAIKSHGKASLDAKFATDEFNLSMANQVKAAGDLALAHSAGKTEMEKLNAQQVAMGQEALKLIDIFGNQAPPALYEVVAGMSDQELAAIGAKRSFDNAGNAIIDLNGKKITIPSNLVQTAQDALTLKQRLGELPEGNHFFNYFINTVVTGPGPGTAPFPIPGHAAGTEYFKAPMGLTHINEQGPEIAQLPQGTRIFTAQRSSLMVQDEVQKALGAMGALAGGMTANITINPPPMADQEWLSKISREVSRELQWRTRQNR
jgi:hypothetical protein